MVSLNKKIFVFIIVAMCGILSGYAINNQHSNFTPTLFDQPPIPNSIQEVMAQSDVVIIGQIVGVKDRKPFYGYGDEAKELEKIDKEDNSVSLGLPIVQYKLRIDKVLSSNERLSKNLVFQVDTYGLDQQTDDVYMDGNQSVWFLVKKPTGVYGLSSIVSRGVLEDESSIFRTSNSQNDPKINFHLDLLEFGDKIDFPSTLSELVMEVSRNSVNQK